jgi:thioredoxin 1
MKGWRVKPYAKMWILVALMVAVGMIVVVKRGGTPMCCPPSVANQEPNVPQTLPETPAAANPLPRLVDLGAGKCVPCKAMAPILDELKTQYKDKFEIVFVDVWENPAAAEPYNINLIPTQIFFDKNGKELFRHEGFFAKEDILAKWKEFGIAINSF